MQAFLPGLRKLCDKHGLLLILDEVRLFARYIYTLQAFLPGLRKLCDKHGLLLILDEVRLFARYIYTLQAFLPGLRKLCNKHGLLLILDEVRLFARYITPCKRSCRACASSATSTACCSSWTRSVPLHLPRLSQGKLHGCSRGTLHHFKIEQCQSRVTKVSLLGACTSCATCSGWRFEMTEVLLSIYGTCVDALMGVMCTVASSGAY